MDEERLAVFITCYLFHYFSKIVPGQLLPADINVWLEKLSEEIIALGLRCPCL